MWTGYGRTEYGIKLAWIKTDCTEIDPYDAKKQSMKFTSIATFQGKFYAISLQGALVVHEPRNSHLVVIAIGTNRAVPSGTSRHFKEHLLNMDGEILLVLLIHHKTLRIVDEVEVFRLMIPELIWIKVENLQKPGMQLQESRARVDSDDIISFALDTNYYENYRD